MTLAAKIAERSQDPIFWIQIEGIPHPAQWPSTTHNAPAYISTGAGIAWPVYADACLCDLPNGADESIALPSCKTSYGSQTFRLLDREGIWRVAFSWRGAASQPRRRLAADQTRTQTTIVLDASTGMSEGLIVWVGRETQRIGTQVGATTTWNVTRAYAGSLAAAHYATTTARTHDDGVYTHPPYWAGRRVELWEGDANLSPTVAANKAARGSFVLDEISWDGASQSWALSCRGELARLGGQLGRRQWRGELIGPVVPAPTRQEQESRDYLAGLYAGNPNAPTWPPAGHVPIAVGATLYCTAQEGADLSPFRSGVGSTGVIRVGDSLVEVECFDNPLGSAVAMGMAWLSVLSVGVAGSPAPEFVSPGPVWEVLPADDQIDYANPISEQTWGYWEAGDFYRDSSVGTVLLNVLLSTGTATTADGGYNDGGLARNYDTLPRWAGFGISASRVDVAGIQYLIKNSRLGDVALNALSLGFDGKPLDFLEWFTDEVLGSVAAFVFRAAAGLFSVGLLSDAFWFDSATALDSSSLRVDPGLPWDCGHARTSGRVEIETVKRGSGPLVVRAQGPIADERREDTAKPDKIGASLSFYDDAGPQLLQTATWLQHQKDNPRPSVKVRAEWAQHGLDLGAKITLAHALAPNPITGALGVSASTGGWVVKSRRLVPREHALDVDALFVGAPLTHIAFAAEITAWDVGTLTLTVSGNVYTPTDGDADPVPSRDYLVSSVADPILIRSSRGGIKSNNAPSIASFTPGGGVTDQIVLSAKPTLGGVDWVWAAGDTLIFNVWSVATTNMQKHAYLADAATGLIGASSDAAHIYGYGG